MNIQYFLFIGSRFKFAARIKASAKAEIVKSVIAAVGLCIIRVACVPRCYFYIAYFSIFGVLLAAPKYPVAKNANINRAAARCIGSLYRPLAKSFRFLINIISNTKYITANIKQEIASDGHLPIYVDEKLYANTNP